MPSDRTPDMPMLQEIASRPGIALVVISSCPFEAVPGIPENAVQLAKPFGAAELIEAGGLAEGPVSSTD